MKTTVMTAIAMATGSLLATSAHAQIINVAAVDPSSPNSAPAPVTQTFDPGTYTVQVVGKAGGGLYDAWAPAVPAAGNYEDRYSITANGTTTTVNPYNGQRFATETAALDAFSGVLTSFTLAAASAVTFSIPDYLWSDNTGGVSLSVTKDGPTPVPEPATIGLFALGGAMLARARKRKAMVTSIA